MVLGHCRLYYLGHNRVSLLSAESKHWLLGGFLLTGDQQSDIRQRGADRSVDSKLPQAFIRQNMTDLEKVRLLSGNSVGIGAGWPGN